MHKIGGIVLLAFFLFACASTTTTSKDAANIKPIGKTFVVVDTGEVKYFVLGAHKVSEYLTGCVEKALSEKSVEAKAVQAGGLELDDNPYQKDIEAFGADTIMSIQLTEGTVNRENILVSGTFIFSIFDVGLKKTVWKAKLEAHGGFIPAVGGGELDDLVGRALKAMKEDGLLLGPAT